jgi:hypothetical protein
MCFCQATSYNLGSHFDAASARLIRTRTSTAQRLGHERALPVKTALALAAGARRIKLRAPITHLLQAPRPRRVSFGQRSLLSCRYRARPLLPLSASMRRYRLAPQDAQARRNAADPTGNIQPGCAAPTRGHSRCSAHLCCARKKRKGLDKALFFCSRTNTQG